MAELQPEEHLWRLLEVDQQRISALDATTLTVKGWAISVDTAVAGVAVARDDARLLALGLVPTLLFWVVDHGYRSVQLMHADRSSRMAKIIEPRFPLASTGRSSGMASTIHSRPILRYWSTFFFYGVLAVGLALLALYLSLTTPG